MGNSLQSAKSIPAGAFTIGLLHFLISQHIKSTRAPIEIDASLYIGQPNSEPPPESRMQVNGIYITLQSNGAYINKGGRRLQRFIVTVWSRNSGRAELGARIVTQALRRHADGLVESAVTTSEGTSINSVVVTGYFRTLLSGRELMF